MLWIVFIGVAILLMGYGILLWNYRRSWMEIVSYKKCVNRSYGQIWFEIELVEGRVLTSNIAGH
jgi:hypothetical protein